LLLMIHLLISCDIMGAGSAFSMSYIIEFGWPVAGEVIPMNCRGARKHHKCFLNRNKKMSHSTDIVSDMNTV
jgi:hypothetical protein